MIGLLTKTRKAIWALRSPRRVRLLRQRCAPAVEHVGVLSALAPKTVLDIGANIGQFSVVVRQLHPDARIYAFEPLAEPFRRLSAVLAGDQQVTLHPIALGSGRDSRAMYVSGRQDSSSLLPIGGKQEGEHPGSAARARESVEVRRLDEVMEPAQLIAPALAKLDVQGYELEVLRGFGTLLQQLRWMLCEVSFVELYEGQPLAHEVIQFLSGQGFELRTLGGISRGRSGRVIQADVLFERAT